MKKIVAVLLAALILVSAAACGGNSDKDKIVGYDPPEGYEIVQTNASENKTSVAYGMLDEDEEMLYGIAMIFQLASSDLRRGIKSKRLSVLQDNLGVDFEENIDVEFVKFGSHNGVRLTTHDEAGNVEELTYTMLVGDWNVILYTETEDRQYLDTVIADLNRLVETLRLEEFGFEG